MVERSTSLFLRPYFDSSQTVEGHVSREGARCSHTQAAPQSDQLCAVMREHPCAARFVEFVWDLSYDLSQMFQLLICLCSMQGARPVMISNYNNLYEILVDDKRQTLFSFFHLA